MDLQKFIALDVVNTNEWEELTRLSIVVEKILREDNKVERDLAVRAECQISNVYRVVMGDTKKANIVANEAIKLCRKKGFFKSEALVKPNVEATNAMECVKKRCPK